MAVGTGDSLVFRQDITIKYKGPVPVTCLRPGMVGVRRSWERERERERELFIGTEFSILYTSVSASRGRVSVCLVFVVACTYALRRS